MSEATKLGIGCMLDYPRGWQPAVVESLVYDEKGAFAHLQVVLG